MFLAFSLHFPCLNLSYIYVLTFFFFFFLPSNGLHCQERSQASQTERGTFLIACKWLGFHVHHLSQPWYQSDKSTKIRQASVMCHQCGQKWKVHSDLQRHQNSLFRIQRRVVLMKTWKILSASTVQVVWMVETKARRWKHIARLFLLGKAEIETEGRQGHLTEGP